MVLKILVQEGSNSWLVWFMLRADIPGNINKGIQG